MSNVVWFQRKAHVVIEGGTITGPVGHPHIGTYRYFVAMVDEYGEQTCVWDGASHAEAIAAAAEWDRAVVDMTTVVPGGAAC